MLLENAVSERRVKKDEKYWEARKLSKSGNYREAANVYREYLRDHRDDTDARIGFCWCLWRLNEQILKEEITFKATEQFKKNLAYAIYRKFCPKTDKLYSMFLNQAVRFRNKSKDLDFLAFLKIWDLNNFKPEDWEPNNNYPALAHSALSLAGKMGKNKEAKNSEELEFALECTSKGAEKFKENIWFVYYKAKILQLLGRPKESESYIASILFSKSGEYWVWHCYAELLEELSDSRSFSFLCKAASLIREEDKARNVRGDLVKALVARGYFGEAKREIAIIDETTERFGFKKLSDIEEVKHHSRWFKDTVAATSNKEFYVEHSQEADEILVGNVPWEDAIVGHSYQNKEGKQRVRLYSREGSYAVPASRRELCKLKAGTPISIKVLKNATPPSIYSIQKRTGTPWDVLSRKDGLVDSVNDGKNCIHVVFADLQTTLVYLEPSQKGTFKPGDSTLVYSSKDASGKWKAVYWEKSTKQLPELRKKFNEEVNFFDAEKGFGFTSGGIFLQKRVCKVEISSGDVVVGEAVKSFNKKRNQWGWTALYVEKKSSNQSG